MSVTAAPPASPAAALAATARSRTLATGAAFWGLMLRDLTVLDRKLHIFLARTVVQPLLLVFVFANVFPRISQGIGGGSGASRFTTILVPGVVALSVIINGVQAVAVTLVQEISYNREIEDRILAPISVRMVAVEKIVFGALQGLFAGLVVFPIAAVVPATPVYVHIHWLVLVTMAPLACVASAALGLTLGTLLEPRSVTFLFSIVLLPLTILGGLYYPWSKLNAIPWLQVAVLANPLIYMTEGFRAALVTKVPHMPLTSIYVALSLFTVVLTVAGIKGFKRRVLT
ncbi:MAG TPA: ABC transporter permease [Acidimicrobiales bacterium]|jgi:ABC-2 type transport system permease protein|nr:ABC transporter permease [Acidimicrobiales bacterium]